MFQRQPFTRFRHLTMISPVGTTSVANEIDDSPQRHRGHRAISKALPVGATSVANRPSNKAALFVVETTPTGITPEDSLSRLKPDRLFRHRQTGFTLLELVLVLFLIALMASAALLLTEGVEDQARYDETKRRMELIRKAIVGDPSRTVNGGPEISGFVADMGRLPGCVAELLTPGAVDRKSVV